MVRRFAACVAFGLASSSVIAGWAADAGPGSRQDRIVASMTDAPPVTLGDLEGRIARMPPFQRALYGATPDAVRHGVLGEVVLRERLLEIAAAKQQLERSPGVALALDRARSMATVRAIRARAGAPSAVPEADVRAYYAANAARWDSPERIAVWRILCQDADEAKAVLDACRTGCSPAAFSTLARQHSRDRATFLRGGDLGFLAADGSSSFPEVRVDPALFRAASGVHDGELVGAPVPEGDGFAVVWRRGTVAAVHRALDVVAATIREQLASDRAREEVERLLAERRASNVRDLDEAALETSIVPAPDSPDGSR